MAPHVNCVGDSLTNLCSPAFGDEKGPSGAKKKPFGVERAFLEPERAHLRQTNSLSDPKRAHLRPKMALWMRKMSFQSQKSLLES